MRAVVQRVEECSITVESETVAAIRKGLLIYLGVGCDDEDEDVRYLVKKILGLRIFEDESGKINKAVTDFTDMGIVVVSQFTLYGDTRKGRRPSFSKAANPEKGERLYELFLTDLENEGIRPGRGSFGKTMFVSYTNYGPMTILLDSKKLF